MTSTRTIDPERLPSELLTLVANVVDRDEAELSFDANLADELEIDSVMRLEILVVVERTYGIKITQEDLTAIASLRDACNLILNRRAAAVPVA